MGTSFEAKGILAAGMALIAIGLERFLNAFLIGSEAASWFARVIIGVLCAAAGNLLLVLRWYVNDPRR